MAHTIDTAYLTPDDLHGLLPAAFVLEALDDDGDGVADAGDAVCLMASNEVDGFLENRYLVPVDKATAPALLIAAVVHIAVELLYLRRGMADKNPYKDKVAGLRKRLEAIRMGEEDLDLPPRTQAEAEPVQTVTMEAPAVSQFHTVLF